MITHNQRVQFSKYGTASSKARFQSMYQGFRIVSGEQHAAIPGGWNAPVQTVLTQGVEELEVENDDQPQSLNTLVG